MSERASIPRLIQPGEPLPWFKVPSLQGNPNFVFDTVAGRPLLILLLGTASEPNVAEAIAFVESNRGYFDDIKASFFGISVDPTDVSSARIAPAIPGIRYFLDFERNVSLLLGAIIEGGGELRYRPHWLVIDRQLRLVNRFDLNRTQEAFEALKALAPPNQDSGWAPVLEIPNVFEPALCSDLIKLYHQKGGTESGFMREVDGKTVHMVDHGHKRRSDIEIDDQQLCTLLQTRVYHRIKPMIQRAFQFDATRMERYIVACYDSETGGHFRPHRDNTTRGTAHRRFAVTINLNADSYDGGNLRFPEFGDRAYRAPTGGAIVFSCSLLHEVLPVTSGKRYAFLPFLYDDAASRIRIENNAYLGDGVAQYQE